MDGVIITTPDFAHLEVAEMSFAAGKHTYLDKPLEVTAERCRAIIRAHQKSKAVAFVGFNLRVWSGYAKIKEICASGQLGQMVHIEGLEQTAAAHGASFHRRFHRRVARSGGWLNTKSSHDMDIMQWFVGHEHKVVRVASFGGLNVLTPEKAPATHCHLCPGEIWNRCPYRDSSGFVFPCGNKEPIHHRDTKTYGGDMCVYNRDKDIFDNQTLIIEWDHGVRGNFNLQGFQLQGKRESKIWFEKGLISQGVEPGVRVIRSDTGEVQTMEFQCLPGGHGGADPQMINRFLNTVEKGGETDSGLNAGLAATLLAEKALESARTGRVVTVDPKEYDASYKAPGKKK
jgi:predicted dehydrogenase